MASQTLIFNKDQKQLRRYLSEPKNFSKAVNLMLSMSSLLHPSECSDYPTASFEDEIWNRASKEDFCRIPTNSLNSIAWHLWHSARIEDITTSFLICKKSQVFEEKGYFKKLNVPFKGTGNNMSLPQMKLFNSQIMIEELSNYRVAVGKATGEAIRGLSPADIREMVSKDSLNEIDAGGYVSNESKWLLDFWGRKDIAGIILMPLTRHLMVHINKSRRLLSKKTGK